MAAAEYNIIAAVASNDTSRAYDVTEDGLVADTETLDDLTCEECFYDPSLPKERRHHRFKDANGKRSHLKTKIHRPEARLIRMLKRDAAPHKYKLWACPYCDDFLGSSPAEVCHHVVDGDCTTSLADDVLDIYDTFINGVGPSLSEQEQNEMVRLVFADLVDDRPVLVEPSVMSGSASGIADWMDTERQHAIQYWDAAVETPGNLDELFGAIDGSLLLTPDVDQPMPDV
ncbi:hypothetical protein B0H10DRAFT_1284099 [Mycena sp. CBHHK59/15]|nr:hypothetical protein B0H10DRAFT_1284099 [Mycena sp. CBHHK59/15]